MNIGKKIEISRREKNWSQTDLSNHSGVDRTTISWYENGKIKKIGLNNLTKIANATNKPISYFLTEEELDQEVIESLKDDNFKVISGKKSEVYTILSVDDLNKSYSMAPLLKKGETMFRIKVEDNDNEPDIIVGDELLVTTNFNSRDEKYYLIRDLEENRVIIRQLKHYGDRDYIRTKNLKSECEFSAKRFNFIGRIVRYERNL